MLNEKLLPNGRAFDILAFGAQVIGPQLAGNYAYVSARAGRVLIIVVHHTAS